MWCDDFDADLPKVVPEAMPILARIPDSVILRTHGHIFEGKLNHPSCWNHDLGSISFFTLDGEGTTPTLGSIAPPPFVTDQPIVACTFTEAVRDLWIHGLVMIVDGTVVWNAAKLQNSASMPLMYHVRGWQQYTPEQVAEFKRRTVLSLDAAVGRLQQVMRRKGVSV